MNIDRPKICFIVSSPMTVSAFLTAQIRECTIYFDVWLVANSKNRDFLDNLNLNISFYHLNIQRKINPFLDLFCLVKLFFFFKNKKFDIIHSITPKAGLIGMLAGYFAKVPLRIHTFTGQVWANKKFFLRELLKSIDIITVRSATNILVDSASQRNFLLKNKIINSINSEVLAYGSISGVDLFRFTPNIDSKFQIRKELNIPKDAIILLYLGRLNRDKGILDLISAFTKIAADESKLWLLLVGPDEFSPSLKLNHLKQTLLKRIIRVGFTNSPEKYMCASDIFCLPSYREGFGTSVIEAAACEVPSIASRIYGLMDAVKDDDTGFLHPPGDIDSIIFLIKRLINHDLRIKMGKAARSRVELQFSQPLVTNAVITFYKRLILASKK
jgi:glycosyltransferase involved in cell wall biosynthesis